MEQTEALRRMMQRLTALYNETKTVPVKFTGRTSHADRRGKVHINPDVKDVYGKSVDGPNELRLITDTLSHEVEHVRETKLDAKKEFAEQYPTCSKTAGRVYNILEDQYIDGTRCRRFPGMRAAHAFKLDLILQNGHRRPPLDSTRLDRGERFIEGLLQVAFVGTFKGDADALDDDLREFLGWVRPHVKAVEYADDHDTRVEIAHVVMQKLLDVAGDDLTHATLDMDLPFSMPGPDAPRPGQVDPDTAPDPPETPDTHPAAEDHTTDHDDADGDGGDGGAGSGGGAGDVDVTALLDGHDPADCEVRV